MTFTFNTKVIAIDLKKWKCRLLFLLVNWRFYSPIPVSNFVIYLSCSWRCLVCQVRRSLAAVGWYRQCRCGRSMDGQASTDENRVAWTDAVVNLLNVVDIVPAIDVEMRLQARWRRPACSLSCCSSLSVFFFDSDRTAGLASGNASRRSVQKLYCLVIVAVWLSVWSSAHCPARVSWLHWCLPDISALCVAYSSACAVICRRSLLVYTGLIFWPVDSLSFWSPRLARSPLFLSLTLSVCPPVCLSQILLLLFCFSMESRVLHDKNYKTLFFDFWFRHLTPKICSPKFAQNRLQLCGSLSQSLYVGHGLWVNEILARRGNPVAYRLLT